jgi:hypothetical protein
MSETAKKGVEFWVRNEWERAEREDGGCRQYQAWCEAQKFLWGLSSGLQIAGVGFLAEDVEFLAFLAGERGRL